MSAHPADPVSPDYGGKHRAKSVPPEPDCLMADIDVTFVQKGLRRCEATVKMDLHHHRQADDFRARLEVTE